MYHIGSSCSMLPLCWCSDLYTTVIFPLNPIFSRLESLSTLFFSCTENTPCKGHLFFLQSHFWAGKTRAAHDTQSKVAVIIYMVLYFVLYSFSNNSLHSLCSIYYC